MVQEGWAHVRGGQPAVHPAAHWAVGAVPPRHQRRLRSCEKQEPSTLRRRWEPHDAPRLLGCLLQRYVAAHNDQREG